MKLKNKTDGARQHGPYLLTRNQLSERWSLSKETLKRREKAGQLQPLKMGKLVRYRLSQIEKIEADAELLR
jgi:hypothetical protein